jgi:uncharacterized peroxidase-related enzyme
MSNFEFHTTESAPEGSKALLNNIEKKMGFIPNLYAGLAEAPPALEAYLQLSDQLAKSSFSAAEQQVITITASVLNGCEFCVAAHSFVARSVIKLDSKTVDALRDGAVLPDERLQALSEFTRKIVVNRGFVENRDAEAFLEAGFSRAQILEVVLGVTLKTLSNYANHLLETPTNSQFASELWRVDKAA